MKQNKKPQIQNKKALQRGTYSLASILIVLAIVVVINLIVNILPTNLTQFDVSSEQLYSVGEQTEEVLAELDEDITIYQIAQEGNEDNTVLQLLNAYENGSSHISVVKKDPALYPGFTANYTDSTVSENSLIVECGSRFKIIDYDELYVKEMDMETYQQNVVGFDGEGQITSAIKYVTSSNLPKIYTIDGHNETGMDATLRSTIEKMNIEIDEVNLLTQEIPADCAALVILSPQSDFSEDDTQKVLDYMAEGGRLLICTNYTSEEMANFNKILNACNLNLEQGVIIDPASGSYAQQNPMYLVPSVSKDSTLSEALRNTVGYVFMPIAEGMTEIETDSNTKMTPILTTSNQSYLKKDPATMDTYNKVSGDVDGPFIVGASAYEILSEEGAYSKQWKAVIFTSASFMTQSADSIVSGGNFTLIKSGLEWLVDEAEGAIAIESKSMKVNYLTIRQSTIMVWTILAVVVLPLIFLLAGGFIWFRRRNK